MAEIQFIQDELDAQIKRFAKESTKHKNMYRTIRYIIFALTGISTVLAGVAAGTESIQYYLNIAIVVTTAAIGVASSYEGLRKPSELWIMERNLLYSLKDLKRELEFELVGNKDSISATKYFDELQALLGAAGEKWSKNVGKRHK